MSIDADRRDGADEVIIPRDSPGISPTRQSSRQPTTLLRVLRPPSFFHPPRLEELLTSFFAAAAVVASYVGKAVLRLMSSQLRHLFYSSQ